MAGRGSRLVAWQVRRGTALEGRSAGRLEWAVRSYLVKGSRARRFRQAGGSRQTEADGVLGCSRSCKCWCVKGRMVGAAWTEHAFVEVEGRWLMWSWIWVGS